MSRILAIGSFTELAGYALVGVEVVEAEDPDDVRSAWDTLAADVALVLLTARARASLPAKLSAEGPLWVVLPA
jgi:vacuolar-type H+-ATPase subunit F/Vma7